MLFKGFALAVILPLVLSSQVVYLPQYGQGHPGFLRYPLWTAVVPGHVVPHAVQGNRNAVGVNTVHLVAQQPQVSITTNGILRQPILAYPQGARTPAVTACPPSEDGHPVFVAHPTDCSLFYECDGVYPILAACPRPLIFDAELNVCNWAEQVDCKVNAPRA